MADSAAVLYVLGGLLVLGSLPVGGPLGQRLPLLAVVAVAVGTGILLHLLAARLPLVAYHLLTAFAVVLITFAVHVGGITALSYTFFYVWVSAWAFYWLTPRMAWLEMGWMAAVSGLEMLQLTPGGNQHSFLVALVYWGTMVITSVSTGLLLTYLVKRRAADQDQLTLHRRQLDDVMAGLPLSVFAFDPGGVITLVEGNALGRMRLRPDGLLGRSVFELLGVEHPFAAAAREALAGRETTGSLRVQDGEYEYRMTPLWSLEGSLTRVSGTIIDVTESRRNEREAMERRAREAFVAKVSHELRTPLNAMLGYLQLFDRPSMPDLTPKQRGYLERIRRASAMQLELVNDLLDLQKLRSGEPSFEIERVALPLLVAEAVDIAAPLAEQKAIRVTVEPADGALRTDRRRVGQALLNLLSNSIKFSPPMSEVVVRATHSGETVRIEVADRGPGLAVEDLDRVFEEFYQAPSAAAHQGTGLGLAISRQIVRGLGGDITVSSRLGEGATFTITLPAAAAAAPASPAALLTAV